VTTKSNCADSGDRGALTGAPLGPYTEGGGSVGGSNGWAEAGAGARRPYLDSNQSQARRELRLGSQFSVKRSKLLASRAKKNRINANFLRVVCQIAHSFVQMPYALVHILSNQGGEAWV
jgi:hypothetical protein